ncbi:unnamed protein product [Phytomonas sp. Hart1]|nr:unnamed protein product [Phytomonas sp. Hart1]|eukprot:CCW72074.1 unnamed protein product [Phytomonas sp. isolate Hart1]
MESCLEDDTPLTSNEIMNFAFKQRKLQMLIELWGNELERENDLLLSISVKQKMFIGEKIYVDSYITASKNESQQDPPRPSSFFFPTSSDDISDFEASNPTPDDIIKWCQQSMNDLDKEESRLREIINEINAILRRNFWDMVTWDWRERYQEIQFLNSYIDEYDENTTDGGITSEEISNNSTTTASENISIQYILDNSLDVESDKESEKKN